ncbi:unnamed protein product, partial [Nesidiocoris tenuis]
MELRPLGSADPITMQNTRGAPTLRNGVSQMALYDAISSLLHGVVHVAVRWFEQ